MELIRFRNREIRVREVARPEGSLCRVLEDENGTAYLEYVISVGPYKVDMDVVHVLQRQDYEAFRRGELDLGVLARNLAEHVQDLGVFERRD